MCVVTENGEDDGDHFATDMADYSHVVFDLSAFALIKRMNCRFFEGCNCRSEPDRPTQVGRTTLGEYSFFRSGSELFLFLEIK